MNIELINILSTHQTEFFSHFFQNLMDLKLTVWKNNNKRSVFFLIQQKCSLFSYAAYGWMTLRIFNQSVKNSLHNFWSFYQIREKTALSFVDFIKVYFFICNDLQCVLNMHFNFWRDRCMSRSITDLIFDMTLFCRSRTFYHIYINNWWLCFSNEGFLSNR